MDQTIARLTEALKVAQDAMQYAVNRLDAEERIGAGRGHIQVAGDLAVALAASTSLVDVRAPHMRQTGG